MDEPISLEELLLEKARSFNKLGYLGFTGFLGFAGFINTDFFLAFFLAMWNQNSHNPNINRRRRSTPKGPPEMQDSHVDS